MRRSQLFLSRYKAATVLFHNDGGFDASACLLQKCVRLLKRNMKEVLKDHSRARGQLLRADLEVDH